MKNHWKIRLGALIGSILFHAGYGKPPVPKWLCGRGFGVRVNGRCYITTRRKGGFMTAAVYFQGPA